MLIDNVQYCTECNLYIIRPSIIFKMVIPSIIVNSIINTINEGFDQSLEEYTIYSLNYICRCNASQTVYYLIGDSCIDSI